MQQNSMTSERFQTIVHDTIGWSLQQFAQIVDRNERTVRRWGNGGMEIPPEVAEWLETIAACHEANPPPRNPRRNTLVEEPAPSAHELARIIRLKD